MNTLGRVVLALDGLAVAVVVVRLARLRWDDPATPVARVARGTELALTGSLVAFVAVHADRLGFWGVVVAVLFAGMLGECVRFVVAVLVLADESGTRLDGGSVAGVLLVIGACVVLLVVQVANLPEPPPPTAAEAASERFGGHVNNHLDPGEVTVVAVASDPVVAQADVPGGEAVPVERYAVDGSRVTLVVAHDVICLPRALVVAPIDGGVAVVVVAQPHAMASGTPPAHRRGHCDLNGVVVWRTAVVVELTADLRTGRLVDAGAGGPARRVD